ncbi:unnamed protein product [Candidula unifasciata]|uniref:Carboxylic ester hydrolase n=1 Tax=Candidula unifasciata TaxID=100452 RepID=A0A8S4A368_9EUPU|nr:unnamed protein product [Candidula unifasciata]
MLKRVLCYTLLLGLAVSSNEDVTQPAVSSNEDVTQPVVAAPAGRFRGSILTSLSGNKYAAYKGIPYALPPTGERRFALPEAYPQNEEDVYDASEFGPICFQHVDEVSYGQEDCLFLNVYTPLIDEDVTDAEQKKVLVFIHGGGFVSGASNVFIPGDLVTQGDVLVVTLNYRLGWLGFLRGDPDILPGNQAFHDQILALRWVKANIAAFGGDPDDVTLSGESAGAISVSILSLSPLASHLFSRAILMSGTGFSFPAPPQESRDLLEIVQKVVGCDCVNNTLSCIQRRPAEKFEMIFSYALASKLPSSGDAFLPNPIPVLVNDVKYLDTVGFFNRDYLVSITKHDGYVRINSQFGKLNITSLESSITGISELVQLPEHVGKSLLLEYLKLYEDLEKAVIALNTDYFYLQRSHYFLNVFGKRPNQVAQSVQTNIYFMSFDPAPKFFPKQYAVHAVDLVYLFDIVPKQFLEGAYYLKMEGDLSEDDKVFKSAFIDLVATFLKTGNPNGYLKKEKSVIWPPYDDANKNYLSFSLDPSVRQNLYGERRIIWDQLLPQWKKEYESLQSKQDL